MRDAATDGSVRIATHQVDMKPPICEPLKNGVLFRACFQAVSHASCAEEVALADIAAAELVVLIQRQRVEVRHSNLFSAPHGWGH
jgi:hypothetical protein